MADEATDRDLEPLAGSTSAGSVPDRDCADLANQSAANRTRPYDRAKEIFPYAPNFARRVSRACSIARAGGHGAACVTASSWRFSKDYQLRAFQWHSNAGVRQRRSK